MSIQQITDAVKRLSTDEAAARLKVKPQTLRAALCRDGHWCNLRPVKGPNRFLYWPADEIERLTTGQAITAADEAA